MNLEQTISDYLNRVNGRRRTRIVTPAAVLRAVGRLAPRSYSILSGGTVANAYKYPAVQTTVVVYRDADGETHLLAGVVSASRGTCPRPAELRPYLPRLHNVPSERVCDALDDYFQATRTGALTLPTAEFDFATNGGAY